MRTKLRQGRGPHLPRENEEKEEGRRRSQPTNFSVRFKMALPWLLPNCCIREVQMYLCKKKSEESKEKSEESKEKRGGYELKTKRGQPGALSVTIQISHRRNRDGA